jgi:DNA-binding transcriptional LysR family regulator
VKVNLVSSFTTELKAMFAAGDIDVVITTETGRDEGAVCLSELELVWYGAPGGVAWKQRPLRVASEKQCIFRPISLKALDDAGIKWEMGVDTTSSMTVEASLSADLAVHARLKGTAPQHLEEIEHGGALPELPRFQVNMMAAQAAQSPMAEKLAEMVREAYCCK